MEMFYFPGFSDHESRDSVLNYNSVGQKRMGSSLLGSYDTFIA
jgi:hypothetical protein